MTRRILCRVLAL
uniref:Uncharacterized protein n=1 Tax=Anopheles dirus TaxID=7168 RepID=A0A182NXJ0_9DIPT